MGFWSWLKHLFSKEDNSQNTDNSTKINNSKHIKQNPKIKGNNNQVNYGNGNYYLNDNSIHYLTNYTEADYNKVFVVKMRWNHLVPHQIIEKKNGIDCFNVLEPIEKDFLKTDDVVELTDGCNKYHGLYLRFRHNPTICNLTINKLTIKTDKNDIDVIVNKNVCGLLDTDKAIVINHKDLQEGKGIIKLTIGYEKEIYHYSQEFEFEAKNDSNEFILRKYQDPKNEDVQTPFGI